MRRTATRIRGHIVNRATPLGGLIIPGVYASAILCVFILGDVVIGSVRPWSFIFAVIQSLAIASLVYASIDIRIGNDPHCNGCGYSARGIETLSACPECNKDWTDGSGLRCGAPWRFRERWIVAVICALMYASAVLVNIWLML